MACGLCGAGHVGYKMLLNKTRQVPRQIGGTYFISGESDSIVWSLAIEGTVTYTTCSPE